MAPVPVELADIAPHDEDQGNPEEVSIESIKLENRNIAAEIAALLAEDDEEEEKEVVAPLAPLRKKRSVAVSDPEDSSGKRNSCFLTEIEDEEKEPNNSEGTSIVDFYLKRQVGSDMSEEDSENGPIEEEMSTESLDIDIENDKTSDTPSPSLDKETIEDGEAEDSGNVSVGLVDAIVGELTEQAVEQNITEDQIREELRREETSEDIDYAKNSEDVCLEAQVYEEEVEIKDFTEIGDNVDEATEPENTLGNNAESVFKIEQVDVNNSREKSEDVDCAGNSDDVGSEALLYDKEVDVAKEICEEIEDDGDEAKEPENTVENKVESDFKTEHSDVNNSGELEISSDLSNSRQTFQMTDNLDQNDLKEGRLESGAESEVVSAETEKSIADSCEDEMPVTSPSGECPALEEDKILPDGYPELLLLTMAIFMALIVMFN